LHIILVQIGSRQIERLVHELITWPSSELQIFISELLEILNPLRYASLLSNIYRCTENYHSLSKECEVGELSGSAQIYRKALVVKKAHSLEPVIVFLHKLALDNDHAIGTILEAGTLDFLLHVYISNFSDPFCKIEGDMDDGISTLRAACHSLLNTCSSTESGLKIICRHRLHILWPVQPELPFTRLISDRLVQRAAIWRSIGHELASLRVRLVFREIKRGLPLDDIAADVLEFYG
jgi:hypothetical protein